MSNHHPLAHTAQQEIPYGEHSVSATIATKPSPSENQDASRSNQNHHPRISRCFSSSQPISNPKPSIFAASAFFHFAQTAYPTFCLLLLFISLQLYHDPPQPRTALIEAMSVGVQQHSLTNPNQLELPALTVNPEPTGVCSTCEEKEHLRSTIACYIEKMNPHKRLPRRGSYPLRKQQQGIQANQAVSLKFNSRTS